MKNFTRTLLYMLTLLLSVASVQSAQAQALQNSLYIFRNDGGFNAFFYSDIDHISYSKVDTLGVEHDDFVTQEVWALDSVYRIPVSAIDSVAFTTPETKYQPGVIKLEDNLKNYVTAVDGMTISLSSSTPNNLVPKAGDKLSFLESNDMFPSGFAGQVSKVESSEGGYKLLCDSVYLSDLYKTIVIKYGLHAETNPEDSTGEARKRAVEIGDNNMHHTELPTISKSFSATTSYGFGPLSADASLSGGISFQIIHDERTHLYKSDAFALEFEGTHFSRTARTQFNLEQAWTLSGSFTVNAEVPLVLVPIPIATPLFRLDGEMGVGMQGQASINAIFKRTTIIADECQWHYSNSIFQFPEFSYTGQVKTLKNGEEWSGITGKASVSVGSYFDIGLKTICKDVLSAGVHKFCGGRYELETELTKNDYETLISTTETPDKRSKVYNLLDRDATLTDSYFDNVSAYCEAAGLNHSWAIEDAVALTPTKYRLVPHFSDFTYEPDFEGEKETVGKFSSKVSGKTLPDLFHHLGFVLYNEEGEKLDEEWYEDKKVPYRNGRINEYSLNLTHPDFEIGKYYYAYPMTTFYASYSTTGFDVVGGPALKFLHVGPGILVEAGDTMELEPIAGTYGTKVYTYCKKLTAALDEVEGKVPSWLKIHLTSDTTLIVTVEKNDSIGPREATVTLSAYTPKGNLVEQKLVIKQKPSEPEDIAAVVISGQIYCSSPTYEENPYIMAPAVMAINAMVPNWVRTTRNGNKMHVECAKVESDENDVPYFVPGTIATFDIIDFDSIGTRKARIENLVIDNQMGMTSGDDDTPVWMEYYKFNVSSPLPMIDETTIQSDDEDEDFGDIDVIGAKSFRVWSLSQAKGLKISNFNYSIKNWHYNWWTGELESEEEHVFSLNNNPANTIQVIVAFK